MRILHTITCSCHVSGMGREQFQRSLIRNRKLTHKGIQRMFLKGCEEYPANPGVSVCHVETAIFVK
jgi:hypothetical protein